MDLLLFIAAGFVILLLVVAIAVWLTIKFGKGTPTHGDHKH